jgi:dipeptidyl aminopeptidase/acylaminoacyl peptidase
MGSPRTLAAVASLSVVLAGCHGAAAQESSIVEGRSPAQAAEQLAEQLRLHPPRISKVEEPLRLYLLDLVKGDVTLVADEPDPGSNHVGSPRWSHDGRRILYDAMPGTEFQKLHIKAIESGTAEPRLTDLGAGACPSWSPDDRKIAFLLNPGSVPGAESGIWVMEADGSGRRRAGEFGIPLWSPDGGQFLVVSFSEPRDVRTIDLQSGAMRPVQVPGLKIFAWPSWAGPGTVVTVLGRDDGGDRVALLDLANPQQPRVVDVLWQRGADLDVRPTWPVYSSATRRCIFVGAGPDGMALHSVERGKSTRAARVEPVGIENRIAGLSLSPGGRFLLFCSTRPDPKAK